MEDWSGEIDPLDQRLWDLGEEDLIRELNLQLAACSTNDAATVTEEIEAAHSFNLRNRPQFHFVSTHEVTSVEPFRSPLTSAKRSRPQ